MAVTFLWRALSSGVDEQYSRCRLQFPISLAAAGQPPGPRLAGLLTASATTSCDGCLAFHWASSSRLGQVKLAR